MNFHREMDIYDIFKFNNINQDKFTANFSIEFYNSYLTHFPEQCYVYDMIDKQAGYMIGKDEAKGEEYHIHVSAVTVAPEFRLQKYSSRLMVQLENIGNIYCCYFCDLFVRSKNDPANKFYEKIKYATYRIIKQYYVGEEDGYDRRKPLKKDITDKSIYNAGRSIKQWIDYEW